MGYGQVYNYINKSPLEKSVPCPMSSPIISLRVLSPGGNDNVINLNKCEEQTLIICQPTNKKYHSAIT